MSGFQSLVVGDPANRITEEGLFSAYAKTQMIENIKKDMTMSNEQKLALVGDVNTPGFMTNLLSGASGAAIGYALSKYLKLGKTAQMLLTLAGFGIGRILVDGKNKKMINYNSKYDMYEVRQ